MPVSGRSMYSSFSYRSNVSCSFTELMAVQEWAEFQFSLLGTGSMFKYQRRIVIIPDIAPCPFYGVGVQGCGPLCYIWIRGDR